MKTSEKNSNVLRGGKPSLKGLLRVLNLGESIRQALHSPNPFEVIRGLTGGAMGLTLFLLPWMLLDPTPHASLRTLCLLLILPLWGGLLLLRLVMGRMPHLRQTTLNLLLTAFGIFHVSLISWYAPSAFPFFWFVAFLSWAIFLIASQRDIHAKPYFIWFSILLLTPQWVLQGWMKEDPGWLISELFLFSLGLIFASLIYAFHIYKIRERLEASVSMLEQVHDLWRNRDFTQTVEGLLRFTRDFFSFPIVAAFLEDLNAEKQKVVALLGASGVISHPPAEVGELIGRLGGAGYVLARRTSFPLKEQDMLHLLFFRHTAQHPPTPFMMSLLARHLRFVHTIALAQYEAIQVPRDPLTGIRTRRSLDQDLTRILQRVHKYGERLIEPDSEYVTVIMMDLDHFKQVNDQYGHETGDAVLREFVGRVQGVLRYKDRFYRYGGEEFTIILEGCGVPCAQGVATRILEKVAREPFTAMVRENWRMGNHVLEARRVQGLPITVSLGIAIYPLDPGDAQQLLGKADEYLYEAKRQGRNRAVWKEGVLLGPTPPEGGEETAEGWG